jgi:multidrug efflux pump subunit AcrA (membrane-fusion protein)
MDGLVYYGKATRGQWPAVSSVAPRLARGGMLQPSEVFLTIVDPRPAFLRATVEEKDLDMIKLGAEGVATPVGAPQSKLAANVAWVEPVPVAPGSFEARVKLSVPAPAKLVPGMAASIKLVTYKKDDALTLPESAVFSDGDDSHYVYLPPYGGKPGKKAVTVGKTAGGRVEILEGLKEGDEILASKP